MRIMISILLASWQILAVMGEKALFRLLRLMKTVYFFFCRGSGTVAATLIFKELMFESQVSCQTGLDPTRRELTHFAS